MEDAGYPPSALAYKVVGTDLEAAEITYGDLRKESERVAAALARLGVGPGDRVATLMGKSSEYLIALMGIWRLGAVHAPIFTAFAPAGIAFRLIRSQAKVIICDETQQEKLLPSDDIPSRGSWKVVTTAAEGAGIPGSLRFAELIRVQVPGMPAA
jgi:acetyl-CoA synthetase